MTGALPEHFRMLAQYNRLANLRLYDACEELDEDELKRERPAFFRSIHGTLNHILVGDRIWLVRFSGGEAPSTGLDAILYGDFTELRRARVTEDARIEAMTHGLSYSGLSSTIRYVNNEGYQFEDPLDMLLAHFFNHQTHHRGQVHDMLMQTRVTPPVLDLHRVLKPAP